MIFDSPNGMKSKKEIFKDILMSAQTNCVLKIKLINEHNPVITAIDRVEKNKITLKPTCLYGYKIKKRTITLLEIESITRYETNFNNPLFEKMRFIKNNISYIRKNFGALNEESSGIL